MPNRVRQRRLEQQWTQAELARRAGISRTAVSAIEAQNLVPSVVTALALARAYGCTVEDIFSPHEKGLKPVWAWAPSRNNSRYWCAELRGRVLLYPAEPTAHGEVPHDGLAHGGELETQTDADPRDTLVVAGCDPAASLLGESMLRGSRIRLLPLLRSSRQALELLKRGLIHAAGLHLGSAAGSEENREAVRRELGTGYRLLRLADWEEGVAVSPGQAGGGVSSLLAPNVRWVGREAGSGARLRLDALFDSPRTLQHIAADHRGVAAAIRGGWADAGVCLRLVGEEAGLDFLSLGWESYDLCFPADLENDPRLEALVRMVSQARFRRLLGDLPGYDARPAGELTAV